MPGPSRRRLRRDPPQPRRRRRRRHRLVPRSALDPLLVPAARRPGLGLPPGTARRPARLHQPQARRKTSTTSTGSCPWSSPSSPRAPAPAPPSASSARSTSNRSPAETQQIDRPRDRPPRDGDHGRQLRRHLLPRPARRRRPAASRLGGRCSEIRLERMAPGLSRCGRPGGRGRCGAAPRRWSRGRRRRRRRRPPTSTSPGRRGGAAGARPRGTSVAVNSSTLRPRTRRPPPLTRMLRTHWVSPRGATR